MQCWNKNTFITRPARRYVKVQLRHHSDLTSVHCVLQTGLHGLTGHIEFNEGRRSNFKLDLLKLKHEELRKVGQWSPATGINVTDPTAFYETSASNITLIVMTREVCILLLTINSITSCNVCYLSVVSLLYYCHRAKIQLQSNK
jgi:hypothetical protein